MAATSSATSLLELFLDRYLPLPAAIATTDHDESSSARLKRIRHRFGDDAGIRAKTVLRDINLMSSLESSEVPEGKRLPGVFVASVRNAGAQRVNPELDLGVPESMKAGAVMASLMELDVSGNALCCPKEICSLLALPKLRLLNLSNNNLSSTCFADVDMESRSFGVLSLVLNQTGIAASQLAKLLPRCPHLRSLHLCGNDWSCEDVQAAFCGESSSGVCPPIEELQLAGNSRLASVDRLAEALRPLRCLRALWVQHSSLALWPRSGLDSASAADGVSQMSSRLTHLNCSGCGVRALSSLCNLGTWPALRSLRCGANPWEGRVDAVAAERAGAAGRPGAALRMTVLGRCPRLCTLGGSAVKPGEVESSERFLVRYSAVLAAEAATAAAAATAMSSGEDVDTTAPLRLPELVRRHGELGALAAGLERPASIALELALRLGVVSPEGTPVPASRVVAARVPLGWRVGRLRRWASLLVHAHLRRACGLQESAGPTPATQATSGPPVPSEASAAEASALGVSWLVPPAVTEASLLLSGTAALPDWFEALSVAQRRDAMLGLPSVRLRISWQVGAGPLASDSVLRDNSRYVHGLCLHDGDELSVELRQPKAPRGTVATK